MKIHIPRMFVGALLLGMAGALLILPNMVPGHHTSLGELAIMLAAAFVGTQVFWGRRLPGSRSRGLRRSVR